MILRKRGLALVGLGLFIGAGLVGFLGFDVHISLFTKTTVVEKKEFVPAAITRVTEKREGFTFTSFAYYPESYEIHYQIDGKKMIAHVKKEVFERINPGDKVEIKYVFSASLEPLRIRPMRDQ